MVVKFLDTYILWEISIGNPKFTGYLREEFVVNDLILAEFYHVLLREFGEAVAQNWVAKFQPYSNAVSFQTMLRAVYWRREYAKRDVSFFDAIGYTYAREHNMLFVTGDKEFKNIDGVEFVPAK